MIYASGGIENARDWLDDSGELALATAPRSFPLVRLQAAKGPNAPRFFTQPLVARV